MFPAAGLVSVRQLAEYVHRGLGAERVESDAMRGHAVNQRQWKNLIQLLGLGSLGYGLYAVWAEYQAYAGLNAGQIGGWC